MKLTCNTCGEIKVAHLNGYDFGDRLLEDVMFEVKVNAKGTKLEVVGVEPSSAEYFQSLNMQKWTRDAKDYLKAIVSDGEEPLSCASCGEKVTYDGFAGLETESGTPVKMTSISSILKNK